MVEQAKAASAEDVAKKALASIEGYEGLLQDALSKQDVGEKYLALKECSEVFKNCAKAFEKKSDGLTWVFMLGAGALAGLAGAVAGEAALAVPHALAAGFSAAMGALVIDGLMGSTEVWHWLQEAFEDRSPGATKVLKALKSLSNKVKQEMRQIQEQVPIESLAKSSQVETLMTMEPFNRKLAEAFKSASTLTNSNDTNTPAPDAPAAKPPKP